MRCGRRTSSACSGSGAGAQWPISPNAAARCCRSTTGCTALRSTSMPVRSGMTAACSIDGVSSGRCCCRSGRSSRPGGSHCRSCAARLFGPSVGRFAARAAHTDRCLARWRGMDGRRRLPGPGQWRRLRASGLEQRRARSAAAPAHAVHGHFNSVAESPEYVRMVGERDPVYGRGIHADDLVDTWAVARETVGEPESWWPDPPDRAHGTAMGSVANLTKACGGRAERGSPHDSALARWSCSNAMASVRAHGPTPKARSTILASPMMPPWRAKARA